MGKCKLARGRQKITLQASGRHHESCSPFISLYFLPKFPVPFSGMPSQPTLEQCGNEKNKMSGLCFAVFITRLAIICTATAAHSLRSAGTWHFFFVPGFAHFKWISGCQGLAVCHLMLHSCKWL